MRLIRVEISSGNLAYINIERVDALVVSGDGHYRLYIGGSDDALLLSKEGFETMRKRWSEET